MFSLGRVCPIGIPYALPTQSSRGGGLLHESSLSAKVNWIYRTLDCMPGSGVVQLLSRDPRRESEARNFHPPADFCFLFEYYGENG